MISEEYAQAIIDGYLYGEPKPTRLEARLAKTVVELYIRIAELEDELQEARRRVGA